MKLNCGNEPSKLRNGREECTKFYLKNEINIKEDNNTHRCDVCSFNVHRVTCAKHISSKKQVETEKQDEMITTDWFFNEPFEKER